MLQSGGGIYNQLQLIHTSTSINNDISINDLLIYLISGLLAVNQLANMHEGNADFTEINVYLMDGLEKVDLCHNIEHSTPFKCMCIFMFKCIDNTYIRMGL